VFLKQLSKFAAVFAVGSFQRKKRKKQLLLPQLPGERDEEKI